VLDKKFFALYGKWKVHHRFHNSPPHAPIVNQIDLSQWLPTALLKIQFNIVLSTPRSSKWYFSLRFPHQNPYAPLRFLIHATSPGCLIRLDL